jgi:hypothetical protein
VLLDGGLEGGLAPLDRPDHADAAPGHGVQRHRPRYDHRRQQDLLDGLAGSDGEGEQDDGDEAPEGGGDEPLAVHVEREDEPADERREQHPQRVRVRERVHVGEPREVAKQEEDDPVAQRDHPAAYPRTHVAPDEERARQRGHQAPEQLGVEERRVQRTVQKAEAEHAAPPQHAQKAVEAHAALPPRVPAGALDGGDDLGRGGHTFGQAGSRRGYRRRLSFLNPPPFSTGRGRTGRWRRAPASGAGEGAPTPFSLRNGRQRGDIGAFSRVLPGTLL